MNPSPNIYRTALHATPGARRIPDGDMSLRQRELADAVAGCNAPADFASAPLRVVTELHVVTIEHGVDPVSAARKVREGLAQARAKLDSLDAAFAAHGADAFRPMPEAVDARALRGETRQAIIERLMRWLSANKRVLTRAGDHRVFIDDTGCPRVCEGEGSAR